MATNNKVNLMINDFPELKNEWNYEKNKTLNIYEICTNSSKKVWWIGKCGHEWDSKVLCRTRLKLNCPYCSNQRVLKGFNDMWTTNSELAQFLVNPEVGYIYTKKSNAKLDWYCSICSLEIINKSPNHLKGKIPVCKMCSGKMSCSEKIMSAILEYFKLDYQHDKSFEWSNGKRYDFYIPKIDTIIELHGVQHYEEVKFTKRTLTEEQNNDNQKLQMAKENDIKNYIIIDARKSDFEFILSSILDSDLKDILNLKDLQIDDLKINNGNTNIQKVWDMWDSGIEKVSIISEKLGLGKTTVKNYLQYGEQIGKCSYRKEERYDRVSRPVVQLDLNLNFIKKHKSLRSAARSIG